MRKKEGMRQTDTKPLTRLITDEVEMINLHSTIWGTVQIAKNRRKVAAQITGVNRKTAISYRKICHLITGVKRINVKSSRKVRHPFTGQIDETRK